MAWAAGHQLTITRVLTLHRQATEMEQAPTEKVQASNTVQVKLCGAALHQNQRTKKRFLSQLLVPIVKSKSKSKSNNRINKQ
mmetsp:Transcript_19220/g.31569  ORF Transcript_19220/g.31569 Transcript_19220/m.31569 type:complete len:82 (-) Transcript_19220:10-255(-)